MGIARGTNIVRDGLVFGYDTGYGVADNSTATRFYPGEPTTNYVTTNLETLGTDGSGQSSIGTRTTIAPNHVKIVDINSNTRQTHLISGLTGGTIYIVSIQFKKIEGTPTFRFQLQDYNGGSYLRTIKFTTTAEAGLEDKYGWQTASYSFTLGSDANAVRIWWQDGADYTTYTHSFELKNPQLEAKNHVTPYVSGTRSATQSLIDLTRTTNIDVSNVSFDSTGQPDFDGTDDRIVSSTGINLSSYTSLTYEGVVKAVGLASHDRWFSGTNSSDSGFHNPDLAIGTNGQLGYIFSNSGISSWNMPSGLTIDTTKFNHLVYTFTNTGVVKIYINGTQQHTATHSNGTFPNGSRFMTGMRFDNNGEGVDGSIPIAKVYSKALTADEVMQNYKAYKNRFNL